MLHWLSFTLSLGFILVLLLENSSRSDEHFLALLRSLWNKLWILFVDIPLHIIRAPLPHAPCFTSQLSAHSAVRMTIAFCRKHSNFKLTRASLMLSRGSILTTFDQDPWECQPPAISHRPDTLQIPWGSQRHEISHRPGTCSDLCLRQIRHPERNSSGIDPLTSTRPFQLSCVISELSAVRIRGS